MKMKFPLEPVYVDGEGHLTYNQKRDGKIVSCMKNFCMSSPVSKFTHN